MVRGFRVGHGHYLVFALYFVFRCLGLGLDDYDHELSFL